MTAELALDFVSRLDELHRTDWASVLPATTNSDATHDEIDRWSSVYRSVGAGVIPLLEEGAAWLHRWAPPVRSVGIVHGDPGPGNFVHDGHRVVAFTDWEFSHLGDPMEDWAYLVTMRGSRTMSRDGWLALFRSAVGVEVSDRDLQYWTAFNYFKGACANLTCRRAFATSNPSPNMALIGTALHQTFLRNLSASIDVGARPPEHA
jgi:aminoglycoside phosphotransferase (APT) family kinase protein